MTTGFDERTGPDAGPIPNTLEVFIRTNFRTWLRVAMTILHSRDDAEDAVQNAQLTMYRRWDRILNLATPDEMRALAISMVKDSAIDAVRARTRETNKVSRYAVLGEVPGDQPTPLGDEVLDRSGLALTMALDDLAHTAPGYAAAVRLRMLGLPYAEIGAALKIASTTAKAWVHAGWNYLDSTLNPGDDQETPS